MGKTSSNLAPTRSAAIAIGWQTLQNLAANAALAPAGAAIKARRVLSNCRPSASGVGITITVTDHNPNITPSVSRDQFKPEPSHMNGPGGSDLSLSIVGRSSGTAARSRYRRRDGQQFTMSLRA